MIGVMQHITQHIVVLCKQIQFVDLKLCTIKTKVLKFNRFIFLI